MSDVSATVTIMDRDFLGVANKVTLASIAFGDSSSTYPSGGIPLGGKEQFGMNKAIKAIFVDQPNNGYVYKVDYSDQSALRLQIYYGAYSATTDGPLAEVTTSYAPEATVVTAMIIGA